MTPNPHYQPLVFEQLMPAEQLARSSAFLHTMRQRRTVRDFSPQPVPLELIQNAVATAGTAPSGANQQPWTFVVVSNPAIKRQIREAAEAEERENYERRMGAEWLAALAHLGTNWQKPHLEIAPYLIVVFRQPYAVVPAENDQTTKVKHYYSEESVGIAVGLLLASLHLAGLATLTHTPSPMAFLNTILRRPTHERAFVVIPVGFPAKDAQVPVIHKKDLSEIMVCVE